MRAELQNRKINFNYKRKRLTEDYMSKGKKSTEIAIQNKSGFALDNAKNFHVALKEESERRNLIQKFIKSQLIKDVDYGVIKITSKRTGKEYQSKPTLFKSGSEKFASLLRLKPVFTDDKLTINQLPDNIKNQGVFIFKCDLVNDKGAIISEGRGAATIQEMSGDINKAVKIAQKRAQTDAVLRLGLSDSFTQDLDDEGNKNYKETKQTIFPDIKKLDKEKLKKEFQDAYRYATKFKKPSQDLSVFCSQLDTMTADQINHGLQKLNDIIDKLEAKHGQK